MRSRRCFGSRAGEAWDDAGDPRDRRRLVGDQPSGVALIAGLRLMSVASSYTEFCTGPGISRGSEPEPPALLERAAALAGRPVSLVSVDMPLARTPITRRRAADDAVSRAF